MDGCTPNATDLHRYAESDLATTGCTYISSSWSPSSVVHCYCSDNYCNIGLSQTPLLSLILLLIVSMKFLS